MSEDYRRIGGFRRSTVWWASGGAGWVLIHSAGPVGIREALLGEFAREFGNRGIRVELPVDIERLAQFLQSRIFRSVAQE